MIPQLVPRHAKQPPTPIVSNRDIINPPPSRHKHISGSLHSLLTFQPTQEEGKDIRPMFCVQNLKPLLPTRHKATNSILSTQHVRVHQESLKNANQTIEHTSTIPRLSLT